eukprot:3740-Heterococcus_DN1.PRE.1
MASSRPGFFRRAKSSSQSAEQRDACPHASGPTTACKEWKRAYTLLSACDVVLNGIRSVNDRLGYPGERDRGYKPMCVPVKNSESENVSRNAPDVYTCSEKHRTVASLWCSETQSICVAKIKSTSCFKFVRAPLKHRPCEIAPMKHCRFKLQMYKVATIAPFSTYSSATVQLAQLVKTSLYIHCVPTLIVTTFVAQTLQQQEHVKNTSAVTTIILLR